MSTHHVTDSNGSQLAISRVERVPWHKADDTQRIPWSKIVGRALVHIEGGGQLHALIVESDWIGDEPTRLYHAVWWDRYTNRFCTTEVAPP